MLRRSVTVYMGSVLHGVMLLLVCNREAWCAINDVHWACRVWQDPWGFEVLGLGV